MDGVTRDFFYQSDLFAVVPMDYYFQEKVNLEIFHHVKVLPKNGMKKTLALMPDIELIILVGKYAQDYYLKDTKKEKLN